MAKSSSRIVQEKYCTAESSGVDIDRNLVWNGCIIKFAVSKSYPSLHQINPVKAHDTFIHAIQPTGGVLITFLRQVIRGAFVLFAIAFLTLFGLNMAASKCSQTALDFFPACDTAVQYPCGITFSSIRRPIFGKRRRFQPLMLWKNYSLTVPGYYWRR